MTNEVTCILSRIESGDPAAAERLLPLVYDELRKLAARYLAGERPGQTLQATALVHEAYVRLVGGVGEAGGWNGRGHFFAAAATAMSSQTPTSPTARRLKVTSGVSGPSRRRISSIF